MSGRKLVWLIAGGLTVLGLAAVIIARAVTKPRAAPAAPAAASTPPRGNAPLAHIRARVFYAAPEGDHLVSVVREIALADKVGDQGAELVKAALEAPRAPILPAVPAGTTLRGFYIADGDAFVDLGGDGLKAPGRGTTAESLAVYAIVNSVTANLPTVKRVQILIEGKEADTLAGHLDLRRPLSANMSLVQ